MKTTAMVLNTYGENATFTKSEINLPPLGDHQVLIEVKATSLNLVDNKILRGVPLGPELPNAIHGDVSGVVTEIGQAVTAFEKGSTLIKLMKPTHIMRVAHILVK